jgi:hypothetical protein
VVAGVRAEIDRRAEGTIVRRRRPIATMTDLPRHPSRATTIHRARR